MVARRNRRSLKSCSALAMTLMLLCSIVVRAQDTTTLSGTVSDPQGKVIPGASITLSNSATGVSRTAKSSDDGSYLITQIQPGNYTVRVEATGFKAAVRENVQLLIRTPTTLDLQLEVGAVNEVVSVSGGEA